MIAHLEGAGYVMGEPNLARGALFSLSKSCAVEDRDQLIIHVDIVGDTEVSRTFVFWALIFSGPESDVEMMKIEISVWPAFSLPWALDEIEGRFISIHRQFGSTTPY